MRYSWAPGSARHAQIASVLKTLKRLPRFKTSAPPASGLLVQIVGCFIGVLGFAKRASLAFFPLFRFDLNYGPVVCTRYAMYGYTQGIMGALRIIAY